MNGGPHEEVNRIRAVVHAAQLGQCTEQQLKRMADVLSHYEAGLQHQMTQGLIEPVKNELEIRQKERRHEANLAEIQKISEAQERELQQVANVSEQVAKMRDDVLKTLHRTHLLHRWIFWVALATFFASVLAAWDVIAKWFSH